MRRFGSGGRSGLLAPQAGCDFGSILANSGICAPRCAEGPQTTNINLNRDRSGSRAFIPPGVACSCRSPT